MSFLIAALALAFVGTLNYLMVDAGQYAVLAESFLAGRLDYIRLPITGTNDTAIFNGKYFWPLGPLPAVIALPFVALGSYHQGTVSFILTLAVFALCFRLARLHQYAPSDACWWAVAFCFGTSFMGVAAMAYAWYFAHVVAVLFLFLAIVEYETRRRFWLVGLLIGLAATSRPPAGLNILFFGVAALMAGGFRMAVKTAPGFAVVVFVLAAYNLARFGSPLESGYQYQVAFDPSFQYVSWNAPGNVARPLFSAANIPIHFQTFAIGLPDGRALGTSVFLVSPFLIYLWKVRLKDSTSKLLALNAAVVLFAVLSFRNVGFFQMGYRFSLDFLPMLFWLMMRERIALTPVFKALIAVAVLADAWMVFYFLETGLERTEAIKALFPNR